MTTTLGRSSSGRACATLCGGLGGEDVEACTGDLSRDEGGVQRLLVDQAAARDVDDERGRLHGLELLGTDHAGGLRRLRHVDREEVGLGDELIEREELHAELLGARRGDVGVVGDDTHVESGKARGDERTDATEADDADRLLEEFGSREGAALPGACGERGVRGGNAAGEAQDVADRELGGGDDVGGRRIDDHDAGSRGRLDVDVVEADSGTGDDLELRGVPQSLFVDAGRRADQHGVGIRECREQRLAVGCHRHRGRRSRDRERRSWRERVLRR